MEKNIMIAKMNQYKSSFFFGIKLIILLSLFGASPFIGYTISSWVNNVTQKIPILYVSPLKITRMQDFEFEVKPKYWEKVDLTSGTTIYFTLNRESKNIDELKAVWKEAVDLSNNTYSVERMKIRNKNTGTEGIVYSFPDYYGTAIYGRHTNIGNVIVIPINIILFILCLASYFPVFKAIFNLFRHKRIFIEE